MAKTEAPVTTQRTGTINEQSGSEVEAFQHLY